MANPKIDENSMITYVSQFTTANVIKVRYEFDTKIHGREEKYRDV